MSTTATCGICEGVLELRFAGSGQAPQPGDFAPTCHRPQAYGDLYRCRECATVQQPSLPQGVDLVDLYRDMDDSDYLAEERGRRLTANWLLDLVERRRTPARMLEIGCGHGLLLDEARRRGWEVRGLELSERSARHGRERYGLDIREEPFEALGNEENGCWDAVLMIDVLEHLDHPREAIERATKLLAPGGVLCVVTPDPASLTARIAGAKWWGLLPAHTFLIARRTLRELLIGQGLVLTDDVPLIRSFSARYWVEGFAGIAGPAAATVRRAAAKLPPQRSLALSLGDERVMLAVNEPVSEPESRLAHNRNGTDDVHVVLPAYHAAQTIALVAADLPVASFDRALLVDDASGDDTVAVALAEGFEVLRHPANRGYGANQKTCYSRAILDGADVVVMVHADHQYDAALVTEMVRPIIEGRADVVMGSRLLEDRAIAGGMPRWKWIGNRALTWTENQAFTKEFSEYHTGYRAFSTEFLRSIPFLRNSDGFVFDQEIFAQIVDRNARVVELPIPTRYFLEASSVSFRASVRYGLETLTVLARYRVDERRRRWTLLRRPAVDLQPSAQNAPNSEPVP